MPGANSAGNTASLRGICRGWGWEIPANGMSHLQNAMQSFAGTETAKQVDFVSRYEMLPTPSVVARGALGMFRWDATPVLPSIPVPVLLAAVDRDTTTLPEASRRMHKEIRQATLFAARPARHMGLIEQTESTMRQLQGLPARLSKQG
ncbi:MAG: Arylesterase [Bryobacterales bacterium]|nr:Arylesterase [Bryobacterales bacterium]